MAEKGGFLLGICFGSMKAGSWVTEVMHFSRVDASSTKSSMLDSARCLDSQNSDCWRERRVLVAGSGGCVEK